MNRAGDGEKTFDQCDCLVRFAAERINLGQVSLVQGSVERILTLRLQLNRSSLFGQSGWIAGAGESFKIFSAAAKSRSNIARSKFAMVTSLSGSTSAGIFRKISLPEAGVPLLKTSR